jgi:hypothetical protein
MAANNLTANGIAELWQQERDLMDYAYRASENALDRENRLATANITADGGGGLAGAAGTFLGSIVNGMATTGTGIFAP